MPFAINNALVTGGSLENMRGDASTECPGERGYHSGMILLPDVEAGDDVAGALHAHGACRLPGFPDAATTRALRDDLQRLRTAGALVPAATGRGAGRDVRTDVRGDATLWLDDPRAGPVAATWLAALDALRIAINRRLFLGLDEVEAHYAAYPAGAFYAKHRDRFRDTDSRVVSLVTYLNPAWTDDDGGALRLSLEAGNVDIAPRTGSVVFLSELEHEVLPAMRERWSIAAWLRRRPG